MPTTIVQAFDKLLHDLQLTEREQAEIIRQAKSLVDNLKNHLPGIAHTLLAGSYSRNTAIRPLHDVSLFVVLDASAHEGLHQAGPVACLKKLQIALSLAYPSGEPPRIEPRAINIRLRGSDIGFDVVPAFAADATVYLIPDRKQERWIKTSPEAQREASNKVHDNAGAKLHPLIRAAKLWNQLNGKPLAPFHLEVLAARAVSTPPPNYLDAFRKLLLKATESVMKSCPDPAGVGPDIDEGLDHEQRTRCQLALKEALRQVDQGLQFDRTWRTDDAHRVFRNLFGEAYPETGRK
jgi:hypothetical protein